MGGVTRETDRYGRKLGQLMLLHMAPRIRSVSGYSACPDSDEINTYMSTLFLHLISLEGCFLSLKESLQGSI
jgi:hypothetical protein